MKTITFILVIVILGCTSVKNEMFQIGGESQVIKNAIIDFSNGCSLYKKDSVFIVSFNNKLDLMTLNKNDNRNYEWSKGKSVKDIYTVNISASYDKLYIKDLNKLPSEYIIKEGKLFFWWNENKAVSDEIVSILKKYNMITDDLIENLDLSIDDTQKAAHYFFCKNNLTNYKRVITNKALGYYNPPILKCE